MRILKGAEVSAKIWNEIRESIAGMGENTPKLAIVRAGERPDDLSYEQGATKKLTGFGLRVQSYAYPADISDAAFRAAFAGVNEDPDVTGILLMRPLPGQICEAEVEAMMDPAKDLDGISPGNLAKVFAGEESGFAPCTAEAVIEMLKTNGISIEGKRVTIVGRSMVVGRPLSMLFLKENATVTICHTRTRDLREACRNAEILVAAAGCAKMLNADYIGPGAIVIDVGTNVGADGRLCGDVDLDAVSDRAAMATPVPGGVGAVTTAVLARHLVRAALWQRGGDGQKSCNYR